MPTFTIDFGTKLLGSLKRQWEDEPDAALETKMPDILATFAVWAAATAPARERHGGKT